MEPGYLTLYKTGKLQKRVTLLNAFLSECGLCSRQCKANRSGGQRGICRADKELWVSSAAPHFGEEAPLVGFQGSGTIFLTHCNLRCIFCQNYDISHEGRGRRTSARELALMMINLQEFGCHNINFVTPAHFTPQIIEALPEAVRLGLIVPIVWNCGGYESVEIIRLLDGIVDIYMPDVKFGEKGPGQKYCSVPDYPEVAFEAVKEMHRQVGDLQIDEQGIATQGLLVRHLVMPGHLSSARRIFEFIVDEISPHTFINIMSQYRPCYRSSEYPEISGGISHAEFLSAKEMASDLGLYRGF